MVTPVYDITKPVLVTGATGFVAGWLVKRLLEEGFTVHGAVRNPEDATKVGHLTKLAKGQKGRLKLFKADLLDPGSYTEAMQDCSVVFHTASPFTSKFTDPERDLVDPAVKGTRNVLETANGVPSVKRVVVTSSCAAIYGDAADCAKAPNGTLTEDVWNTTSDLTHQPYAFSKTEAEKAAWSIAEAQNRWSLVTINPSLVLGPGLAQFQTSDSFNLVRQLGDGSMKPGVPEFHIGGVDVRDVAEAHMHAGFIEAAKGRYIVSARTFSFLETAQILRQKFGPKWPFPTRQLPKALVWLIGPLVNKALTRKLVARSVGHPWKADNTRSKAELGMTYRPLDTAMTDMFQQMIDAGYFKK